MIRGLFGCEPDKLSTNLIAIRNGTIFSYYGEREHEVLNHPNIDLTTVGLYGYDKTGGVVNGELYLYYIWNSSTDAKGFIATSEKFAGDVTLPSGFQIERKLPWGVMYNSSWDGVPNFHNSHWPSPMVTLTDSENSGLWCALSSGANTSWTTVDLSAWIPDNARVAHIICELRTVTGAGTAYLRSHTVQTTGIAVGSVTGNSGYSFNTIPIRVDSLRKIQYKVNTTACALNIYVLGYNMTEPA